MSTHPRTDKVSTPHIGFYSCATVPSSFAAELETENESLKKEVETLKTKIVNQCDRIQYLEGATSHACGTPLSIAIKERNEARNKVADALQEVDLRTLDYERMKEERDEAREISMKLQTELSELKLHNSNLQMSNIRLNNLLCEHGILEYGN